jgi:hypothetical protein
MPVEVAAAEQVVQAAMEYLIVGNQLTGVGATAATVWGMLYQA